MTKLPTYEQIVTIGIFQKQIAVSDEINYDINTHVLTFIACEGGLFQCLYNLNVVGTNKQVEQHYIESLRNSFPNKRFTFKGFNENCYRNIRTK